MRVNGLWFVAYPTKQSEMVDIVWHTDWTNLALQIVGGLKSSQIHSAYTEKSEATAVAAELLERERQ